MDAPTRRVDTFVFGAGVDGLGEVSLCGWTYGTFPGQTRTGVLDAVVRTYDALGNEVATHQFAPTGTALHHQCCRIRSGGLASQVYVAGLARGAFAGQSFAGAEGAFAAALSP